MSLVLHFCSNTRMLLTNIVVTLMLTVITLLLISSLSIGVCTDKTPLLESIWKLLWYSAGDTRQTKKRLNMESLFTECTVSPVWAEFVALFSCCIYLHWCYKSEPRWSRCLRPELLLPLAQWSGKVHPEICNAQVVNVQILSSYSKATLLSNTPQSLLKKTQNYFTNVAKTYKM